MDACQPAILAICWQRARSQYQAEMTRKTRLAPAPLSASFAEESDDRTTPHRAGSARLAGSIELPTRHAPVARRPVGLDVSRKAPYTNYSPMVVPDFTEDWVWQYRSSTVYYSVGNFRLLLGG